MGLTHVHFDFLKALDMGQKTKRKGTPIHPYVRVFAAFLPCIGIGILEVVFFLSTGYLCLAFPLSIVTLVILGHFVWKDEEAEDDEKLKRDESDPSLLRLEDAAAAPDQTILQINEEDTSQRRMES